MGGLITFVKVKKALAFQPEYFLGQQKIRENSAMKKIQGHEEKVLQRYKQLGGFIHDGQMINKDKESRAQQWIRDQEKEKELLSPKITGEGSREEQIRNRYIELGGLIRNGEMINKDKESRAKQYIEERERLIKQLVIRYDPRKTRGPSAYSEMTDIEAFVRRDLNDGHFIEAYAITDQYVDTVIKLSFPEIFYNFHKNEDSRMNIETVLRCVVGFELADKKIVQRYRDFKSTRDDLTHKSIFNQSKAKQLENISKVGQLPFDVIKIIEELFHKRVLHAYLYFFKNNKPTPSDFIPMWYRIWKKQGRNLIKFFDDIERLAKQRDKS